MSRLNDSLPTKALFASLIVFALSASFALVANTIQHRYRMAILREEYNCTPPMLWCQARYDTWTDEVQVRNSQLKWVRGNMAWMKEIK